MATVSNQTMELPPREGAPVTPLGGAMQERANVDEHAQAEAGERRMQLLTECALLDGLFRAKTQNGESGVFPADVELIRHLQAYGHAIATRRTERGQG